MFPLWRPDSQQMQQAQIQQFSQYIEKQFKQQFASYQDFHLWSVEHFEQFWEAWWEYSHIISQCQFSKVVERGQNFWDVQWFLGATLNFAENLLRFRDEKTAIVFCNEQGKCRKLSYQDLYVEVAKLAEYFTQLGVKQGDRIAGYLPNMPEAIIAMLATTALGAIWSSTSPDFGEKGVLDRFGQIEPKILLAIDGYYYNGKPISIVDKVNAIVKQLPSVEKVVLIPYLNKDLKNNSAHYILYPEIIKASTTNTLHFVPVPADHPLYILYSSGTTGLPKTIVHRTAGVLLQHLKEHRLHVDIKREDVLFYYTTTGWMMWNWLVSGLASGCTLVCYDGSPTYPSNFSLWQLIDELKVSVFGTSAKYLASLSAQQIKPKQNCQLSSLRCILSTGSVLPDDIYQYVYHEIKSDVLLSSISGGTDIVSCFALGNPGLPVYCGELQCIGLGMDVHAFDEARQAVIGQQGELVCTTPFPSMPLGFWNDQQDQKYIASYFSQFPNAWYHGDFIIIYPHGGVRFLGRSDATLNPGGVRIGTAEIYAVVEGMREVQDCIVVGQWWQDDERVILFVQLKDGCELNDELRNKINLVIRKQCTPRHVPAKIIAVLDIPYTLNGKKVELAVKKLIHGEEVKNKAVLRNPESLQCFSNLTQLQE